MEIALEVVAVINLARFTKGYLLVITGTLVATLALFVPWSYFILWSGGKDGYGITIHVLGIEMMSRSSSDSLFYMSLIICLVLLWLLAFWFYKHGNLKRFRDCYLIMIIGAYGSYASIFYLDKLNGYIGIGLLLSGLAFFTIVIGGNVNRNEYLKLHIDTARVFSQLDEILKYRRNIYTKFDPDDITTYPTTKEIFKSRRFTAAERQREYRRRGKSPSGVIDGVYNDTFLEDGGVYNDVNRDWDADA